MYDTADSSLDFTVRAWEAVYDTVDNTYFLDQDTELIYKALQKRLKSIPFGDYLKRYIYKKAGLTELFDEVPLKIYQQIIRDSFSERQTPPAFEATTAKLGALSKNWLSQQTVKRKVVFLLGFGLGMSVSDVNEFLTKALREQGINAKSPFEVICWYCYKNGYGYQKFNRLWREFCETPVDSVDRKLLYNELTVGAWTTIRSVTDDASLLAFVSRLKDSDNKLRLSVTARKCFDELFDKSRDLVAELYNRSEEEKQEEEIRQYQNALLMNENVSDWERQRRIQARRGQRKVFSRGDISESDLERIISSAIPVDRHGNLLPSKASKLNEQFAGKRFSRQHISNILAGKSEITRFDLITLNFFIYSQTLDEYPNQKSRYVSFVESTNRLLKRCSLGRLYIANPYESFVLMCILSEDPLGTYADVWEQSYET